MKVARFQTFGTRLPVLAGLMVLGTVAFSCTPKLNGEGLVSLITTSNELRFIPENKIMTAGNPFQVAVAGGTEPYFVTIYSGRGTLDTDTLIYQAETDVLRADPGDQGEVVVLQAVDATGKSVKSKITIVETLEFTTPIVTVGVDMDHAFGATGGVPPYAYSITSGAGSINNSSGIFTAASSQGTVVVRVRDSENNEAFAFVTVVPGFGGSTEDEDLPVKNTYVLVPSGGQSPYTFQFVGTGAGTITSSTGNNSAYVAPSTVPGTNPVQVQVTDSLGQQMIYRFNIVSAVQISPSVKYVEQGDTFTFSATGGIAPYIYADDAPSSSGSIDAAGLFTATTTTGSMSVKVTDAYGNTSTAVVHVYPPLQIAPTNFDWQIGTSAITFSASGGDQSSSYSWTRVSGSGTPASGTGASFNYTPASVADSTETVRVSDPSGNTSTATIRVYSPFMLSPASVTMQEGNSFTITPSGGIAPYNFTLNAGTAGGEISATSGSSTVYTASGTNGTETITVTDSIGNNDTFSITVQPPLAMTNDGTTVAVGNNVNFTPTANTGGTTPLNFSATCGDVTAGGVFEAPLTVPGGGTCTVTLSDSFTPPNTVDEVVTINPALALSIDDNTIDLQQTATLTASGGVPPYTISQTGGAGLGTFTFGGGSTATFEADNTPGVVSFQVTDSKTSTPVGTASATINMPTPINHPAGSSFILSSGDSQALDPAGGVPSYDPTSDYTFTITAGSAYLSLSDCTGSATTCTGQTATVTAATVAAQQVATVQLSDGVSSNETISFTINPDVQIDPTTLTLTTDDSFTFSTLANTGVPTFIFSILSGGGEINDDDGLFDAELATPGTATTIQVRDRGGTGETSSATATIRKPLAFSGTGTTLTLDTISEPTYTFNVDTDSGVPPFTVGSTGTGGSLTATGAGVTSTDLRVNAAGGGPMTVRVTDSWSPTPHTYETVVTFEVPAASSAPTFPAGAITNVAATTADASWNQVNLTNTWGSSPISDYEWNVDGSSWNAVSGTSDQINGLGNGATHTLSVRAVTSGGAGPAGTLKFCDLDYYLSSGSCTLVGVGEYSPGGTVTAATGCSNGTGTFTYLDRGGGANNCPYECSAGFGTSSCAQCAAGTYDPTPTPGSAGTDSCVTCGTGQYSAAGATSCTNCGAGNSTNSGHSSCTSCAAGTYSTGTANATCSACTNKPGGDAGSAATSIVYTSGNTSSTCGFVSFSCPANSTKSGDQCNCDPGYGWNNGACEAIITCYDDLDGDGYGAGAPMERFGSCDLGDRTNNTDCYDGSAEIHPGAAAKSTPIGIGNPSGPGKTGTYDYNCDGSSTVDDNVSFPGVLPLSNAATTGNVRSIWIESGSTCQNTTFGATFYYGTKGSPGSLTCGEQVYDCHSASSITKFCGYPCEDDLCVDITSSQCITVENPTVRKIKCK